MLKTINVLLNNLGEESLFGVILDDAESFVKLVGNSDEFIPGQDFDQDSDYNLWESKFNNHTIMGVCCTEKWVIVPNHHIKLGKTYKYKKDNITDLAEICQILNENGYKCKVGVLRKTCGCT